MRREFETMDSYNPFDQLSACCFGRRPRNAGLGGGFKTAAVRNQYYYSPSMAHMGAGWPMTSSGIAPTTIYTGAGGLPPRALQAQPYILLTQPVIVNAAGQLEPHLQQHAQTTTMALMQQPTATGGMQGGQQIQTIQYISDQSALHKVPSMVPSQFAIYSTNETSQRNMYAPSQRQMPTSAVIYETPARQVAPQMIRNISAYLNQPHHQQQQQQPQQLNRAGIAGQQPRKRRLNAEIFKRLEIIEKQVDLSADMDLVERHGIVITRPIEPITLAPHLTDDMLRRYQTHLQFDDEHVIKFIEIIKRPGQTLGLYIRVVQFESPDAQVVREGVVITKIESDSPVYTSKVLHIGDEVLSINLIDIQSMSLDDVVTLMSIPKRLVLVLRVPKGRESQQLLGCERTTGQLSEFLEQRYSEPRQPVKDQSQLPGAANRFEQHHSMAGQPMGRANFGGSPSHPGQLNDSGQRHEMFSGSVIARASTHIARPARVQPPNHGVQDERGGLEEAEVEFVLNGSQREKPPGGGNVVGEQSSAYMGNAHNVSAQRRYLGASTTIIEDDANQDGLQQSEGRFERPRSPIMSHLDRQIAISQSIDESRIDNSGGFRSYSMDPEIAKLEREATISKNKPPSPGMQQHLDGLNDQQQRQQPQQQQQKTDQQQQARFEFELANSSGRKSEQQAPSTLPRRTLPTRPDLIASSVRVPSPGPSIKPAVISNIRLGETPEQSNYFTSSIEAINRELKELRRQRLAMSSCQGEEANVERNPELNLNFYHRNEG